eukprot:gene1195-567_t
MSSKTNPKVVATEKSNQQQAEEDGKDDDSVNSTAKKRQPKIMKHLIERHKRFKRKRKSSKEISKTGFSLTSARAYAFNFFLFSALGSLMPFLPIFYGLLGFTSLENGLLYGVRPLISFWCGPMMASVATSTKYRGLMLFLCIAGAIASTFSLSTVHSNDAGILVPSSSCLSSSSSSPLLSEIVFPSMKYADHQIFTNTTQQSSSNSTLNDLYNGTALNTWRSYLKHSGKVFYHKLQKGLVLKNLFLYVLGLTIVSEFFLSPTLHIAQACIKHNRNQSLFTNICLNRVFSKIGMMVSAITISFIAYRYQCLFSHVHYFYFHFYGFLATGCVTVMAALVLPREAPCKNSFLKTMCIGWCYALSSWSSVGYIFGLWVAGMAEGAINAYLLWFAASNGASEMLIGMLVTIAIMTDMVLHFSVGMSTKWIGHSGLLCCGVFFMSIQFFILSQINNPLYLIPSQLLCGLASSCIKASLVSCSQANGSKEMEKTLCFVFQSAYLGVGLGVGSVLVSLPYYVFGPKRTFIGLAIFTAAYTVIHILINCFSCKKNANRTKRGTYTQVATHEINGRDWLLDALEEEGSENEELKDLDGDFIVVHENIDSHNELDNVSHNNGQDIDINKNVEK